jgi:hypothetical protein
MAFWGGMVAVGAALTTVHAENDGAPLFPFLISYDAPDNVVNVSQMLEAPAGKHGFVRVENGRFVNDAGRVRLHATNLTGPANFPTHAQADNVAARLARFGINCVRLHYFDAQYGNFMTPDETGLFGNDSSLPKAFAADPAVHIPFAAEQVDRQDYLIAALKRRGIYVDMNLHIARFPKGLSFFETRIIASEKEYAKRLLTRVNPYTGLAYTDDPCVAVMEINNENALFNNYLEGVIDQLKGPYADEFRGQWNAWLAKKYARTEALKQAWNWVPTPLCDEQIPEGAFARPVAMDGKKWILQRGTSQATSSVSNGVLRLRVPSEGGELFPKLLRTVSVKQGQPYTVSFRVRRTEGAGSAVLGLAIADTVDGWRSLGLLQKFTVDKAWKKMSCSFVAVEDSAQAQVQITRFDVGAYEFDDVSFQRGAVGEFSATARLEGGSVPIVKNNGFAPLQARRDFYQFIVDTERAYWTGLSDFLKRDLKVKSVISGTQVCGYSPPFVQAELDYVDNHSYWCHPSPVSKAWRIRNESMVNSMDCIRQLASERVLGKPYTISEYNHPFPNQYGAEGQPMLRAYGAFQGWDGVFEYTYNHSPDFEPRRNTYFFSMVARTDVLAHMPACAAMYLRGDVREAQATLVGALSYPAYFERLLRTKSVAEGFSALGFDGRQAMLHKVGVELSGANGTDTNAVAKIAPSQKVFVSDTGELTWNIEQPGAGYFAVNTPNTKLFTGFPKGRTIPLGEVSLTVGATRLNWATVSLVSHDATGFGAAGRPARILLAATGEAANEGPVIDRVSKHEIAYRDRVNWGDGTVAVEGITAVVTLPSDSAKTTCFALDPRGERTVTVPVEKTASGSKIAIGPQYKTVWYEIEVR